MELYTILGVSSDATTGEIKKAYRKLVKTHHPDVGGDPETFREINEAYELLIDPKARKRYDETGDTTTEKEFLHMAEMILANWLAKLIHKGKTEFLNLSKIGISKAISELQEEKTEHKKLCEKFKDRIDKLSRKDKSSNDAILNHLRGIYDEGMEQLKGMNSRIAVMQKALDIADAYYQEPEPVTEVTISDYRMNNLAKIMESIHRHSYESKGGY